MAIFHFQPTVAMQCSATVMRCRLSVCLSSVVCNTRVLWSDGFMDQDATWYGGRPWPKWHCIRWGPNSTHPKRHSNRPHFFGAYLLWPNGCI